MIDYGWFRVIVRFVGVLLVIYFGPTAVIAAVSLAINLPNYLSGATGPEYTYIVLAIISSVLTPAAAAGVGVYFALGGNAFIRWCMRGIGNFCPTCGYDIRGLTATRCPECNGTITPLAARDAAMALPAPHDPPPPAI